MKYLIILTLVSYFSFTSTSLLHAHDTFYPHSNPHDENKGVFDFLKEWITSEDEKQRQGYKDEFSPEDQKIIEKQLKETDDLYKRLNQ